MSQRSSGIRLASYDLLNAAQVPRPVDGLPGVQGNSGAGEMGVLRVSNFLVPFYFSVANFVGFSHSDLARAIFPARAMTQGNIPDGSHVWENSESRDRTERRSHARGEKVDFRGKSRKSQGAAWRGDLG